MAKETEPKVTTWIPAPHDHGKPVEPVVETVVEETPSE